MLRSRRNSWKSHCGSTRTKPVPILFSVRRQANIEPIERLSDAVRALQANARSRRAERCALANDDVRQSVQTVSASDAPVAKPSTSRLLVLLKPTAMITATAASEPPWRSSVWAIKGDARGPPGPR